MRRVVLLLSCVSLSACSLFQRPFRPEHAPPEESARFVFPLGFPPGEHTFIPATISAAVGLAMDDFLPRGAKPPKEATPDEVCLAQRSSYDVLAKALSDSVVLVSFSPRAGACVQEGIALDVGATYAVDVSGWRILAVQR
ncbi:hypothetical protein BHS06_03730 [Myxococcus xanthus]|uniref:hypothetical protein n=1 Tax=Myxococcus xanthus TaxID=34 RepID=UPI00112B443A|nr:hypothetical protein [Myxococcus xanthus]QDE88135.1 hypothetical protein BHS06_03730 [Myxococcus xanthus]